MQSFENYFGKLSKGTRSFRSDSSTWSDQEKRIEGESVSKQVNSVSLTDLSQTVWTMTPETKGTLVCTETKKQLFRNTLLFPRPSERPAGNRSDKGITTLALYACRRPAGSEPNHISQAKNQQRGKMEKENQQVQSNHRRWLSLLIMADLFAKQPRANPVTAISVLPSLIFLELPWPNRTKGMGFKTEQEVPRAWSSLSSCQPSTQLRMNSEDGTVRRPASSIL